MARRIPAASALVALLAVSAVTLPGLAAAAVVADDNGTNLGALSVDPASGSWDAEALVSGTFVCPAVSGSSESVIYPFISEVGKESPAVSAGTAYSSGDVYFVNGSVNDVIGSASGEPAEMSPTTYAFPNARGDFANWYQSEPGDLDTLDSALEVGSSYSLVAACGVSDGSTTEFALDATGHVAAGWSTFEVTATGWAFSGTGPAPTPTPDPDPEPTPDPETNQPTFVVDVVTAATSATIEIELTDADGAPVPAATGTIEFETLNPEDPSDVVAPVSAVIADGATTGEVTGLSPDTEYEVTATYLPDEASELEEASEGILVVTLAEGDTGGEGTETLLVEGGTILPGTTYRIEAPAATFDAGDSIAGAMTPGDLVLAETTVAENDGSASYRFEVPAGLQAGANTITLTGTPSSKALALAVTVAEISAGGGTTPPGTPGTTPANPGFAALTDWVSASLGSPQGLSWAFAAILALSAVGIAGWNLLWRSRRSVSAG